MHLREQMGGGWEIEGTGVGGGGASKPSWEDWEGVSEGFSKKKGDSPPLAEVFLPLFPTP